MEVSGQLDAPAALPPWKEPPVPIEYEAGWARCGKEKNLAPAGNRTPAFQSVARRHAGWALSTHYRYRWFYKIYCIGMENLLSPRLIYKILKLMYTKLQLRRVNTSCGYKIQSLILKDRHRLMIFKHRILRRISRHSGGGEVTRRCKKNCIMNKEFLIFIYSWNIIEVIRLRMMICIWHRHGRRDKMCLQNIIRKMWREETVCW
jgi:hypothetical protein